jgi:methyl-accepting chemotaxis protein
VADAPASSDDLVSLPDRLWRDLGMVQAQTTNGDRDSTERAEVGSDERRELDDLHEPVATETMQTPQFIKQLKDFYDRTRDTTAESLGRIISRIQSAFSRLRKASADLDQQSQRAESITDGIDQGTEQLEQQTNLIAQALKAQEVSHPEPSDDFKPSWG